MTAGIAVPFVAVTASGHAERATAGARGELGTTLTDLLSGAAELQALPHLPYPSHPPYPYHRPRADPRR